MSKHRIAVVGVGYVGLPLAMAIGKEYQAVAFDINPKRINDLREGIDRSGEMSFDDIKSVRNLEFSSDQSCLKSANVKIVAVPTPVTEDLKPDLTILKNASRIVGENLNPGDTVIFESTVYPGATEEVCVPILEKFSGIKCNIDFGVGYSPERINPGDKLRPIEKITKVVAGSNSQTLRTVVNIYESIIEAGVHVAGSIKIAEAAKVIENTQRDVNIALMNELSIICERIGIDTNEVLDAASTKWNFLKFFPGLVGGHCIGVDPYYLAFRAHEFGIGSNVILSSRSTNDAMSTFVVEKTKRLLIKSRLSFERSRVLLLGATFKENCSDLRNSKVLDLSDRFQAEGFDVCVCDPVAVSVELREQYENVIDISEFPNQKFDVVLMAVPHSCFVELGSSKLRDVLTSDGIFLDLKAAFDKADSDWRL